MTLDLTRCSLCPRQCGVDRTRTRGVCGAGADVHVAKIMLHQWEEPCISGTNPSRGSGAVFFSHCPLGCVFCQNQKISRRDASGASYTPDSLANEFLKLSQDGAHNINLVSPTHYTPQLIDTVRIARSRGLTLPIVWNTGGYERVETIAALSGTVDIYLTDFKYADAALAETYSHAADYPDYAADSLAAMVRQVGACAMGDDGLLRRGVIVRHLVLPGHRADSIAVLRRIAGIVDPSTIKLSLMAQYTPEFLPPREEGDPYRTIRRRVTTMEYNAVSEEALRLGFDGYMQDRASATKQYTPDF